ncbi:unnamed protein product [Lasius platythorax]|uniref:Uncharacterized protein n=1 Tax=Lasius platythorax TaxID=488582 RepID=A0AAV2MZE3_9HYME
MEKQLQELSNQVTVLKRPIVKLTVDVENILTLLKTQVRTSAKTSSEDEEDDENPIQLPCDSMEQFEQFNENLRSNKKYKKKL